MTKVVTSPTPLGIVNGHIIGIVLKELARRALGTIRDERRSFEVKIKQGYSGNMDDMLTSADKAAQEVYVKSIRECFPDFGIIGEEDNLCIQPQNGCTAYFTIDPLDGTKAFVRRQSHGVGTMVALVLDGKVISAWIGDVNTQEMYGFRPDSNKVWRISEFNDAEALSFGEKKPLKKQYVLLRDRERLYSDKTQRFINGAFKDVSVDGGSIGIWFARLWKREVGAVILSPSWETPWDSTPVIGISQKLGYKFFQRTVEGEWFQYSPIYPQEKFRRPHETLVVHENDIPDISAYLDK